MPSFNRSLPKSSRPIWPADWCSARVALLLGLLLGGGLLVWMVSGCTITEITLYKTVNNPAVVITPSAKIGPS